MIDLFTRNPFHILELTPQAERRVIEHQAQKILGMLELAMNNSDCFATPLGIEKREAADVRQAMAELLDPCRFHFHAFWFLETAASSDYAEEQGISEDECDLLGSTGY